MEDLTRKELDDFIAYLIKYPDLTEYERKLDYPRYDELWCSKYVQHMILQHKKSIFDDLTEDRGVKIARAELLDRKVEAIQHKAFNYLESLVDDENSTREEKTKICIFLWGKSSAYYKRRAELKADKDSREDNDDQPYIDP